MMPHAARRGDDFSAPVRATPRASGRRSNECSAPLAATTDNGRCGDAQHQINRRSVGMKLTAGEPAVSFTSGPAFGG
jgi:hypothetical protein